MEKQEELIISHDELVTVCKACFEVILEADLMGELDAKLAELKIIPGFAERANEIQQKFSRERLMLIATGGIQ